MKLFLVLNSVILIGLASLWPLANLTSPSRSSLNLQNIVPVAPIPVLSQPNSLANLANLISAQTAFVLDLDSKTPLYTKQADQKWFPASTTKLMTALVARKIFAQQESLVVGPEVSVPGNKIDLAPGSEVSISELLYGLLVASGNDAAQVLAAHHPGGYEGFIREMNQTALSLGLKNTNFQNPSGLDAPDQYSSAKDLAIIASVVYSDPILKPIISTKEHLLLDINQQPISTIWNTNVLLGSASGVVAGKTGTTEFAGQVLVSLVEKNNRRLAVVVMGSQDRYVDTQLIIDRVFENYRWEDFELSE